jgi:hypothetical protein
MSGGKREWCARNQHRTPNPDSHTDEQNQSVPRSDSGDVGRDASVTSLGLNVLEYTDGSGDS